MKKLSTIFRVLERDEKLKNIDVLIIDWASIKNKILLIIAVIFFAGVTIGFCVGCSVENSLREDLSGVYSMEIMNYVGKFI